MSDRVGRDRNESLPRGFWAGLVLATGTAAVVMGSLIAAVIVWILDLPLARPLPAGRVDDERAVWVARRPRAAAPVEQPAAKTIGSDESIAPEVLATSPPPAANGAAPSVTEPVAPGPAVAQEEPSMVPEQAPALMTVVPPVKEAPQLSLAESTKQAVDQRLQVSSEELLTQLGQVPEMIVASSADIREVLKQTAGGASKEKEILPLTLQQAQQVLGQRLATMLRDSQAQGLPVISKNVLGPLDAQSLKVLSKQVREAAGISPRELAKQAALRRGPAPIDAESMSVLFQGWQNSGVPRQYNVVPTLLQMLQVESDDTRTELIKELSRTPGQQASTALAFRALFDPAPEIRSLSIKALQQRPRAEYRTWLIKGLRYPWAPVADRAARALVELKDSQAVPQLVALLPRSDPAQPEFDEKRKQYHLNELVRINHLGNCCLCHAPSLTSNDPVRGLVPTPGEALPVQYYEGMAGPFVRADITYLRQDFSLMQEVENEKFWPTSQRFDFLVRTRKLSPAEVKERGLDPTKATPSGDYPQRQAVYYALSSLTGKDLGLDPKPWQDYLAEKSSMVVVSGGD